MGAGFDRARDILHTERTPLTATESLVNIKLQSHVPAYSQGYVVHGDYMSILARPSVVFAAFFALFFALAFAFADLDNLRGTGG